MGVQGYRVTAVQEVRAGYKIDTGPCTVSHPNIQTLGSVNTGADGSFVLPYTAATKPPGACSFSAAVYIKVFDGAKLLWTSPKRSAARQVTFNYERGGGCACNSIPANAIGKDPLIILMSPNGDDSNCGFTLDTPVLTLERVQEVIASAVPNRDRDVEVRIGAGTY